MIFIVVFINDSLLLRHRLHRLLLLLALAMLSLTSREGPIVVLIVLVLIASSDSIVTNLREHYTTVCASRKR